MTTANFIKLDVGVAVIELSKTYDFGGVKHSSLRMREPTVSDQMIMEAVTGSDAQRELSMFCNLCEITPDDINKLSLKDYKRLQAGFKAFID